MQPLIIRSQEELAGAVEALIRGINDGIKAAGDAGVVAIPPDEITVEGIYLVEANVGTITTTTTTPETTETATQSVPQRVSTSVQSPTSQVTAETATPSGRTTAVANAGGDEETIEREYEDV